MGANRQAGSSNKVLLNSLKKRLEVVKVRWPKELHRVLWAYHAIKSSIEEISFFLVYRSETLIPIEIGEPSLRLADTT